MSHIRIIAELAQGFEGKIELAKILMKAAADTGADAVKYQLVYADELATPDYTYYNLFKGLEMDDKAWEDLATYATDLGIELQLDIFGSKSLSVAERIGIKSIKLHGTDITNLALLNEIAKSPIPSIAIGAGGAHLSELESVLNILQNKSIVILLGFQGYPTVNTDNQIARVRMLSDRFENINANGNIEIGFADHSSPESALSYALPAIALGAGARVIEKHLTLSKVMKFEDYESALNVDEFAEFVTLLRKCDEALGKRSVGDDFGMSSSEENYRNNIRRHVVTTRDIPEGTSINPADLTLKRTSEVDFISDLTSIYGKIAIKDLPVNTPITTKDLK